jgi:hypothetical protein
LEDDVTVTDVDHAEAPIGAWLDTDLDSWTRRVLGRHFDPVGGSPYWLSRRAELGFDPRDITRYEQLAMFEPFALTTLRDLDPVLLVPAAVPRPLAGRVWESGGTTGRPSRVFYTQPMSDHHTAWRVFGLRNAGFERGRTWLYACPSGPHIVGRGADQIAHLYDSTVYAIDLDPRLIKRFLRDGRPAEANMYIDHVVEQVTEILETGRVDYLESTPALVQALLNRRPELVSGLAGVGLGGTQFTSASYRVFHEALGDGLIATTYGNTFGCAMGLPAAGRGDVLPYVPSFPQVTMAVVDKDEPTRVVGLGELGRVRLTVLHDDLFLPNILERDQAVRYDTGDAWPCDGVANVRPLQSGAAVVEGLY